MCSVAVKVGVGQSTAMSSAIMQSEAGELRAIRPAEKVVDGDRRDAAAGELC